MTCPVCGKTMENDRRCSGHAVVMDEMPNCDLCKSDGVEREALYDGATRMGPWGYLCEAHFQRVGMGLGTGRGQRLVPSEVDAEQQAEMAAEAAAEARLTGAGVDYDSRWDEGRDDDDPNPYHGTYSEE